MKPKNLLEFQNIDQNIDKFWKFQKLDIPWEIYENFSPEETVQEILESKNFNQIADLKYQLQDKVNEIFKPLLIQRGYSENFINCFNVWDIRYLEDKSKEQELVKLLFQKNAVYRQLLQKVIELWKLDKVLSWKDVEDISSVIRSWFFDLIDEMVLNWFISLKQQKAEELPKPKWTNPYYGGFDRELKTLWVYTSKQVNLDFVKTINNSHLKQFIVNFLKNINQLDNKKWEEEVLVHYLDSWLDKDSKLAFDGMEESYVLENVFIDPFVDLMIKQPNNKNQKPAADLAEKYFKEVQIMEQTYLFEALNLLSSGISAIERILWRNFPNSPELSKKYWKMIYSLTYRFPETIDENLPKVEKLLKQEFAGLRNDILKQYEDFVAFHEYGHNLFKSSNYNSQLEEYKADLFYYLRLLDQKNNLTLTEKEAVVVMTLMDLARRAQTIESAGAEKYVLWSLFKLRALEKSGLLVKENGKLKLENIEHNFGKFLSFLKEDLDFIKALYFNEFWKIYFQNDLENKTIEKIKAEYLDYLKIFG